MLQPSIIYKWEFYKIPRIAKYRFTGNELFNKSVPLNILTSDSKHIIRLGYGGQMAVTDIRLYQLKLS